MSLFESGAGPGPERGATRRAGLIAGLGLSVLAVAVWFVMQSQGEGADTATPGPGTAGGGLPSGSAADVVPATDEMIGSDAGRSRPTAWRLDVRVTRWPDSRLIVGASVRVASTLEVIAENVLTSRTGRVAVQLPEDTGRLHLRATAPGFRDGELILETPPTLGKVVELSLRPSDGWIGRVTTMHGVPVAGVQVSAHHYWPPRPTLIDPEDGQGVITTSMQGLGVAGVGGPTNATGHYYVEPFDENNVVELVLSVLSDSLASDRMHVPMPYGGQELPDLVASAAYPLDCQVVDRVGRAVAGARVNIDRAPGMDHVTEQTLLSEPDGWLRMGRLHAYQHVRVDEELGWFLGAFSQGVELPVLDGWVRVEADAAELTLVFDGGGGKRGLALDAENSAPMPESWASFESYAGEILAEQAVSEDGSFELRVHPDRIGQEHILRLSAIGYESREYPVSVDEMAYADQLSYFLPPGAGSHWVTGEVMGDADLREIVAGGNLTPELAAELDKTWPFKLGLPGMTVRAWLAERGGPVGDWVAKDGLPDGFELVWEGQTDSQGVFGFLTSSSLESRLLVVSEFAGPDGALYTGRWGPETLARAMSNLIVVTHAGSLPVEVRVEGLDGRGDLVVQQTSWNPWTNGSWTGAVEIPSGSKDWVHVTLDAAGLGWAFFDVRLVRGPVSAPVASSDGWVDLSSSEQLTLEVPPFHTVSGEIVWYSAADWPDLCVALVGQAVPTWRDEWIGEGDWCARPARDGRFRFAGVPPGDYLFMLYRPVGHEGVEVLAQREVSVQSDLFHLDIWSERPGADGYLRVGHR
jgi:hypothetical protein